MFIGVVLINLSVTVFVFMHMIIFCGGCKKKDKEEEENIPREGDGEGRGGDSGSHSERNASYARDSFRTSAKTWQHFNPVIDDFLDQLVGSKKTGSQQVKNPGESDIDKGTTATGQQSITRKSTCNHKADIYWQPEVKLAGIRSDDTLRYIDAIPEIQ